MTDVVLIQPLETLDDAKGPTLASMENLGLAYLKATLLKAGISVLVINAEAAGYDASTTAALAVSECPSIVGVSPVAMTMRSTLEICNTVKRKYPRACTVLGGHHASLCSKEILLSEDAVDYVFLGDAELPFLIFARAVLEGKPIPTLPSVATREKYLNSIPLSFYQEEHLDQLPWPIRESLIDGAIPQEARLITARGCGFRCSFCTTPTFYASTHFRNVKDVVKEIESLYAHGVHQVWLNDDLFVANSSDSHRRCRAFCEELRRSSARVTFRPMVRADSFSRDRGLVDDLVTAGMSHVFVGTEAGNDEDLRLYRKDVDIAENIAAIRDLKGRTNLVFQMGFIMFNPWSTIDSLRANLAFLSDSGEMYRAFPLFRCLSVFPNTYIASRLAQANLLGAVTYKSETPYAYKFADSAIGLLARLQHDHYRRVSIFDSAIYRHVSLLLGQGQRVQATELSESAALVNLPFFDRLLRLVEGGRLCRAAYDDVFLTYLDQYRVIADSVPRH
jgi:radical SAM superfamily enzyme YgiQ (UPF0313 family)